ESLPLRSLSINTTADSGNASTENREIRCSTLSSKIRNSSRVRSGTSRPLESFTVTGRITVFTVVIIFAVVSLCGGALAPADASESPPGRIPLYEFFLACTGAAGKSFTRKVYMPFFYRIAAVTATSALALGCFAPALNRLAAQEPAQSGGTISSQVSLVNLFA